MAIQLNVRFKLVMIFFFAQSHSHLVFPPGSDVGYIVPDAEEQQSLQGKTDYPDVPHNELAEDQVILHTRQTREDSESGGKSSSYSDLWYPHRIVDAGLPIQHQTDVSNTVPESLLDDKHGVKMGVKDVHCDDGQYEERVPSYGDHRPIWPAFGEYKFVPPQRWLHNIEHGAVVMLYHPCTQPHLVAQLRTLVTGCLYKHVITPYTPLTPAKPLALVAWGCRMEMAYVDATQVKDFIRSHALKGPEGILRKQGLYTEGLVQASHVPEGHSDEGLELCPQ
ncbi:uncharacterized protein LOC108665218 [Hyalella azteca]|uniref:Uncharacterized protein LOC108665218 n=1 Tax=Hyalella azteca TaxID=294128 RepID=A0A979FXN9_HYAAZ|nr:uncharacterized protein LOC108665218 [Hyalella azteca]